MKVYKIATKKPNKDGKNYWPEIGTIFVNDDGQMSGYLNNNPEVKIYLFPVEKNNNQQQNNNFNQQANQQPPQGSQLNGDDYSNEPITFGA